MRLADRTFTGEEFLQFVQMKFIYAWIRGETILYVGKTTRGLTRFAHHPTIIRSKVEANDTFKFWFCETDEELDKLEIKLIIELKPILNGIKHNLSSKPKKCKMCGVAFIPVAPNQVNCSKHSKKKVDIGEFV